MIGAAGEMMMVHGAHLPEMSLSVVVTGVDVVEIETPPRATTGVGQVTGTWVLVAVPGMRCLVDPLLGMVAVTVVGAEESVVRKRVVGVVAARMPRQPVEEMSGVAVMLNHGALPKNLVVQHHHPPLMMAGTPFQREDKITDVRTVGTAQFFFD